MKVFLVLTYLPPRQLCYVRQGFDRLQTNLSGSSQTTKLNKTRATFFWTIATLGQFVKTKKVNVSVLQSETGETIMFDSSEPDL